MINVVVHKMLHFCVFIKLGYPEFEGSSIVIWHIKDYSSECNDHHVAP
jgi:hypothetical protein